MAKKYTEQEAYSIYKAHNLTPLEKYKNCKSKIKCINEDGYYIDIKLDDVMQNKKGKIFSKNNRFVLDNIKKYISDDTNGEYKYVSGTFENAYSEFEIKHIKCGRKFKSKWCNIHRTASPKEPNRTGTRCPFCEASQLESTHALVLKQIWLHEHGDTITEDKSCINPNTNCPLPTDIVNHRLKIAIEVQSWFHDKSEQKLKDKIKRDYWLERGYKFYAVDQRNYTVLQMIQIFFPYITSIPDYIDFDYSNKLNDVKVQQMLNNGMSVHEIAKIMNCTAHKIYDAIRYGRIEYPKDYKNKAFSPVVQLDENFSFINEFEKIKDAIESTGIKYISDGLSKGIHKIGGYIWYYKNDYELIKNTI